MQQRINDAVLQMRTSNRVGSHMNCIRLNSGCSDIHNDKIIELCKGYLRLKIPFYTEAIFREPYGRADIFCPATSEIIEVLHSETEERFAAKKYPEQFRVWKVRTTTKVKL